MQRRSLLFLGLTAQAALAACGDVVADETFAKSLALLEVAPRVARTRGGERVTLTGRRFCPELRVRFGEVEATEVEVLAPEVAVAITPEHPVGEARVTISCPDGQSTAPRSFRFAAADVRLQTRLEWPRLSELGWVLGFADLDGDGLDELVRERFVRQGSEASAWVDVYRATGRNGFEPEPWLSIPDPGRSRDGLRFFAGDLTGDGQPDLALVRMTAPEPRFGLLLNIYTSESAFTSSTTVELGGAVGATVSVAPGDFDGDGLIDVVYADATAHAPDEGPATHTRISFARNLGHGAFAPPVTVAELADQDVSPLALLDALLGPQSAPERDLDGDGRDDAILRSTTSSTSTHLLYLHGTSGPAPELTEVELEPFDALAYVDDDRLPDTASITSDAATGQKARIQRASAFGVFDPPVETSRCTGDCDDRRIFYLQGRGTDYDGDGLRELLADTGTDVALFEVRADELAVEVVPGLRALVGEPRLVRGGAPTPIAISDSSQPRALWNDGLGPFAGGVLRVPQPRPLVDLPMYGHPVLWKCVGDFSGTGRTDIMTPHLDASGTLRLAFVSTRPDGSFDEPRDLDEPASLPVDPELWNPNLHYALAGPRCLTADLDGDGLLDAIPFEHQEPRVAFLNRGERGFLRVPLPELAGGYGFESRFQTYDVDQDGRAELVLERPTSNPSALETELAVVEVDANGGRVRASLSLGTNLGVDGAAADLDGDGTLDFARLHARDTGLTLDVLRLEAPPGGPVRITPVSTLELGDIPGLTLLAALHAVDVDGDGALDLVAHVGPTGTTVLFGNDGHGHFTLRSTLEDQTLGAVSGVCDLDADGREDLVYTAEHHLGFALASPAGGAFQAIRWLDVEPLVPLPDVRGDAGHDLLCTDLDHDGLPDLLFQESERQQLHVLYNRSR